MSLLASRVDLLFDMLNAEEAKIERYAQIQAYLIYRMRGLGGIVWQLK